MAALWEQGFSEGEARNLVEYCQEFEGVCSPRQLRARADLLDFQQRSRSRGRWRRFGWGGWLALNGMALLTTTQMVTGVPMLAQACALKLPWLTLLLVDMPTWLPWLLIVLGPALSLLSRGESSKEREVERCWELLSSPSVVAEESSLPLDLIIATARSNGRFRYVAWRWAVGLESELARRHVWRRTMIFVWGGIALAFHLWWVRMALWSPWGSIGNLG